MSERTAVVDEGAQDLLDRRVLDERARHLARSKPLAPRARGTEMVLFSVGRGRYAVAASYALEIARLGELARLPHAPRHMGGVVARRGEALLVVDLPALLHGTPALPGKALQMLVLGDTAAEFALAIDEAHGVREITIDHLDAPPPGVGGRAFVLGVHDGHLVLDGGALFSDESFFTTARAVP